MSSNQPPSGSQKLRKNGSSPSIGHKSTTGPLRATIPVSLMSQTNLIPPLPEMKPARLVNSPTHQQHANNRVLIPSPVMIKSNTLQHPRSRQSPWRLRQWSPIPVGENTENLLTVRTDAPLPTVLRRTASLDAIYLKGQWPRGTAEKRSCLLLDKATQTPEEWQEDKRYSSNRTTSIGFEVSPSRDRKYKQRFLFNTQSLNPPLVEYQLAPSSGSISPNRVAVSTNTEFSSGRRAASPIPVPLMPRSRAPIMRNSVEGFNTEIEKLVWTNKNMEPTPDGHRAPITELFRYNARTVNTQTPVNLQPNSTSSSSGASSPCGSVSPCVLSLFDHHHSSSSRPPGRSISGPPAEEIGEGEYYHSLSPEDFQGLSLGTSPRRRFLCREPPDGCERVETVKVVEQPVKSGDEGSLRPPMKINAQFVLQPSSSSAFCSLSKLPTIAASTSHQQLSTTKPTSSSSPHLLSYPHNSVTNEHTSSTRAVSPQQWNPSLQSRTNFLDSPYFP